MPGIASERVTLRDGLFLWQAYDPAVKTELFSTAIATAMGQITFIDPIPLAESELHYLSEQYRIDAMVITNVNHHRAASWFAQKFSAPVFAHRASFVHEQIASAAFVREGDKITGELQVIELEGAALGEIALYAPANGGTLIVGDALINLPSHGFSLLPRKYCTDGKQLRRSIRKLLDYPAERLLFAHGTPMLSEASARLRGLLTVDC